MKTNDLTPHAMEGWNGNRDACPHLWSSPAWYAYQVGYAMRHFGMPEPTDVRMGRGNKVRVRDLVFDVILPWRPGATRATVERVQ